MSNVYSLEPPTSGKVILKTNFGNIDIELFTKEAPRACQNFLQHCVNSYYNKNERIDEQNSKNIPKRNIFFPSVFLAAQSIQDTAVCRHRCIHSRHPSSCAARRRYSAFSDKTVISGFPISS